MLGFLRRRLRDPATLLRAPLHEAAWDGAALSLVFDAAATEIALDLDGCHFATASIDPAGRAIFAFAFSPSGHEVLEVMPRLGRDGKPLADQPLRLRLGAAGIDGAKPGGGPRELAPLQTPAQRLPSGVDAAARDVAIVVPVYNAPALVERCLDSVLAHTTGRARLIVIDDASPDPAVAALLERYADIAGVELLRHATNRGFTATANRGIAAAGSADVVLLNADTEVGPNWLPGLRRAAHERGDVGTVTAVSDNAGAFSVPELEQANALPAAWTFEQSARALWQHAGLAYPELPTGNGFCLYIRRAVIDDVGALDEAAFPQGYGEENDFCQRAARAGFRHLIAGNVLVRHARSQSFGEERRHALGRVGMAVLRERWPNYEADVGATLFSFERRVLDWRVRRIFADARAGNAARPRVLWAGTQATAAAAYETWSLRVSDEQVALVDDRGILVSQAPRRRDRLADAASLERPLRDWLQTYAIECVIAAAGGPSALLSSAAALGIPIARVEGSADPTRICAEAFAAARSFAERKP